MAKKKIIFAMVKRLFGPNKGKAYKRYFTSEAHKAEIIPRYTRSGAATVTKLKKEFGRSVGRMEQFVGKAKNVKEVQRLMMNRTKKMKSKAKLKSWIATLRKEGFSGPATYASNKLKKLERLGQLRQ